MDIGILSDISVSILMYIMYSRSCCSNILLCRTYNNVLLICIPASIKMFALKELCKCGNRTQCDAAELRDCRIVSHLCGPS